MDPLFLGLAAPSIASTVGAVGRAASAVAKPLATPFAAILHATSQPISDAQPRAVGIGELDRRADALQEDLEQRIAQAIHASGVQLDTPIRLSISEFDGTLETDAVYPQRAILEAALADDPSLANDFRELAVVRKLLAAAEEHVEFAEEYARDPQQAIASFTRLGDDRFEALLHLSSSDNKARLNFE